MYKITLLFAVLFILSSCSKSLSNKEVEKYTIQGKEIAQATAKKLGGNLVEKMKDGGVKEAVPFCNTKAISLTDEMANKFDVTIKRTSHLLRNENNKPNDEEVVVINNYRDLIENGKKLKPVVELDNNGNPHFYAPIILQKKCLACHGEVGIDVTKKSDSIIESHYPKDLATGFKEGDLRGIWSITFKSAME
ncbi:MAG: DUF3365 domain-containing protein [Flavobacteriaceae bacterium]|nr:DUF3365 domain-containing protein [Flavobacteriaceae bacterium]